MTVPPDGYELYDEETGKLYCPFCDSRMLRIGRYAECTGCGEQFQKRAGSGEKSTGANQETADNYNGDN